MLLVIFKPVTGFKREHYFNMKSEKESFVVFTVCFLIDCLLSHYFVQNFLFFDSYSNKFHKLYAGYLVLSAVSKIAPIEKKFSEIFINQKSCGLICMALSNL